MEKKEKFGIVAFGFGEPADLKPNRSIAERAMEIAFTKKALFICTDRDVGPHITEREVPAEIKILDPALFPNTYRLALMAIHEAKKSGIDTLQVVAAPCHIWRCVRDLRWAAEDLGVTIKLVQQSMRGDQYDSNAATWFTRSAWVWWPFEMALRIVSSTFPKWYKQSRA